MEYTTARFKEAAAKAADSIEAQPERYSYMHGFVGCNEMCILAWIGHHLGMPKNTAYWHVMPGETRGCAAIDWVPADVDDVLDWRKVVPALRRYAAS